MAGKERFARWEGRHEKLAMVNNGRNDDWTDRLVRERATGYLPTERITS